jgi:Fe-S cluster biogenesis protein NfuA
VSVKADPNLQQLSTEIEQLGRKVESISDPAVRADVLALVHSVMELHAAGLGRILEILSDRKLAGREAMDAIAADDLAGSLLSLHGLHPVDVVERVSGAVVKAQSELRAQGASLEFLRFEDGVVHLRLAAGGHGCGSSSTSLQRSVEDSIYDAAPEIASVQTELARAPAQALVQLQPIASAAPRA